jgi:uncharacterized protein (TIGR02145 family)
MKNKTTTKIVAMVAMSAVMMAVAMSCGDDNSKKSDEQKQEEQQKKSFPFGTAKFASAKTWTVGTQTWSDAVECTGCKKEKYRTDTVIERNGVHTLVYLADCRKSEKPENSGDAFTWQMGKDYDKVLCPGDWRMPTDDDLKNLYNALGGSIETQKATLERYVNEWGLEYNYLDYLGDTKRGAYWSNSEDEDNTTHRACSLLVYSDGSIFPYGGGTPKSYVMAVRCVKDVK